jgi:hypothetical protein
LEVVLKRLEQIKTIQIAVEDAETELAIDPINVEAFVPGRVVLKDANLH